MFGAVQKPRRTKGPANSAIQDNGVEKESQKVNRPEQAASADRGRILALRDILSHQRPRLLSYGVRRPYVSGKLTVPQGVSRGQQKRGRGDFLVDGRLPTWYAGVQRRRRQNALLSPAPLNAGGGAGGTPWAAERWGMSPDSKPSAGPRVGTRPRKWGRSPN